MGDNEYSKNSDKTLEMESLSMDISKSRFSRDLLQRFMGTSNEHGGAKEEDEEIELNLGLSMGGRFGVDKSSDKLVRSSSVSNCLPEVRDGNDAAPLPPAVYASLVRTSSLPVETEEEWRKRKELQTLRRMEAKRRRSQKQRILNNDRDGGGGSGSGGGESLRSDEKKETELNLRARLDREKSSSALKRTGSSLASQFGMPPLASAGATSPAVLRSGSDVATAERKGRGGGVQFSGQQSQGSVESKGSSSSTVTDLEIKTPQDNASIQSTDKATSKPVGGDKDSPFKRPEATRSRAMDIGPNSIEDMPCVFTKGDGPNGRRVDGILYKYRKGEEVRIMCICHGTFHSPAEFVVHAGGADVDNPLKHIVVNSNSPSLL